MKRYDHKYYCIIDNISNVIGSRGSKVTIYKDVPLYVKTYPWHIDVDVLQSELLEALRD